MLSVISGTVLACSKRTIKGQNGQADTNFFEYSVDFGDGLVILTGGKELQVGKQDFKISPRSMYDRVSKIKPVGDDDIVNIAPAVF